MIKHNWDREISGRARSEPPGKAVAGHRRFTLGERGSWSRVLLAQWCWILLMTSVATAGAAVLSAMQTPMFKAQAEVVVYPASSTGSALQPFVMGTEKGIASSGAVLSIASELLFRSEDELQRGLSISIPVDTNLLVVSFSDPDPQVAQSAAEGIAQAYIEYRNKKAPRIATGNSSATPAAAGAVQAVLVTDAALPTSPVSPNRPLIIGSAVILGLALGIGLALILDKMDDGLRGPLDLQTQAGAPILAQIPTVRRKRRSVADGLIMVCNPGSTVAD